MKKFLFFVLIVLSSLQARDQKNTHCKHDKPLLQKIIKLTAFSFSVAHIAPVIEKIYPHIYGTIEPFFSGKNNNFTPQELVKLVNAQSIKKTFLEMKSGFIRNSMKTPKYALLLFCGKLLTNFGLRFIF